MMTYANSKPLIIAVNSLFVIVIILLVIYHCGNKVDKPQNNRVVSNNCFCNELVISLTLKIEMLMKFKTVLLNNK